MDTESLMMKLIREKESANEVQEHKYEDWDDNYELYRGRVKTNRLTQRQAVNIPLMKETIKTTLSKIDDAPSVDWMEKGGDEGKEILYQEIWDANMRENKVPLIDVLDKKNVLLYGLSTKMLNITEKGVEINVLDTYDVAYDPLMNAGDVESARFIIRQNIFKTVREILADDRYSKEGKDELKRWIVSAPGIQQSNESREQWEKKMERMKDMGLDHQDFKLFAGGDTLVNLTEHYTTLWNEKTKAFERRVITYADNQIVLLDETLEDLLGLEFWPFIVWSEDPETNDIYPDSVADMVRTPNKVMNVWFSQLIENRTLKNFQMHWYNPVKGYTPQTYTPGPGVMLPAPPGEDIGKMIKPVEISGLDDTMEAISILTQIVERGTGATAIEKGSGEAGQQTLGEIQILVGKAMERSICMAKFYRMAWYETAYKWGQLMHANAPKVLNLYKKGRSGRLYPKKVFASDWKSKEGYEPVIASTSEQEQESIKTLQKFQFMLTQFPQNAALQNIAQKRMLESLDLTPEELKEVENDQKQVLEQQVGEAVDPQMLQQVQQGQPQATPQPNSEEDALLSEIDTLTTQLQ